MGVFFQLQKLLHLINSVCFNFFSQNPLFNKKLTLKINFERLKLDKDQQFLIKMSF
jgi:hypothetical protein